MPKGTDDFGEEGSTSARITGTTEVEHAYLSGRVQEGGKDWSGCQLQQQERCTPCVPGCMAADERRDAARSNRDATSAMNHRRGSPATAHRSPASAHRRWLAAPADAVADGLPREENVAGICCRD
ncbi:unnamed protein product, partial [Sphacelaria rigidula]